jgi:hypothetical protein
MVQPKYSPEEALERVKLMMKYDTSKTLNENKESIKQPVNEFVGPLALLAAVPAAVWAWSAGGAAVTTAIGTWIYNVQGGGDSFSKTKSFFAGCKTNIKDLKPTVSKEEYRSAADSIYNAIEGFGTDEDAIKAALNSMPTVADLCALNSWYSTQYGDLYDDLDGDIDGTDFTKYVWSAIAPKVADAVDELETAVEEDKQTPTDGGRPTTGGYKPCAGSYSFGCKADAIATVQGCLGLTTDGKFGPKTQAALKAKGYESFTDAEVDKICGTSKPEPTKDEFSTEVDAVNYDDFLNM